jgi:hypothetical protein
MKYLLNTLKLVYPPISNQEAEWLKNDPDVQNEIKLSNLYMICQREETFFEFDQRQIIDRPQYPKFKIKTKYLEDTFTINLGLLTQEVIKKDSSFDVVWEFGSKLIRFINQKNNEVIEWFTTEKILYDRSCDHRFIIGLDSYKSFMKYQLHYIGISKEDDSLTRLIIKPHDKRLRILSNEKQLTDESRLTDELILLFFNIEDVAMRILDKSTSEEFLSGPDYNRIQLICDAEKAFVKILKSEYNTIQFKHYPLGKDGLANFKYDRYGYVIGEDITLSTASETIRGSRDSNSNEIDLIRIENGKVTLVKGD